MYQTIPNHYKIRVKLFDIKQKTYLFSVANDTEQNYIISARIRGNNRLRS
jgi:hypothetical protein